VVGGGAVVAAATIPIALPAAGAFAAAEDDAAILEAAVSLEQTTVVAYGAALRSGRIGDDLQPVFRLLLGHEQEHVAALSAALADFGRRPPPAPGASEVEGLGALRSATEFLRFAVELENAAVGAYLDAQTRLQSPALRRTGVQIMANEGQHLTLLRQALGASPAGSVPSAFEAGTETV
jgi:rubrerythrin